MHVPGAGFIPASVARQLVAASDAVRTTIQRLFHFPETGVLVAMEREVRAFPADLKGFIDIRDHHICRTPWCNAPIRHFDHPDPIHNGGHTSSHNGQGLCEACNYAKESPGWRQQPISEGFEAHTVEITTPTGHIHRSRAPDLPVPQPQKPRPTTRLEAHFVEFVLAS